MIMSDNNRTRYIFFLLISDLLSVHMSFRYVLNPRKELKMVPLPHLFRNLTFFHDNLETRFISESMNLFPFISEISFCSFLHNAFKKNSFELSFKKSFLIP